MSSSPTSTAGPPARVIGIGASAGGVDALTKLVSGLPADLRHALCIVLHVPAAGRSLLPQILSRFCALPVEVAEDGATLRAGGIHVAPPDRHLLVRDGRIELTRGPKENGVRPAVDTMLRSLAAAYGSGAVAVVLSGALGDGSNGAIAVALAGGTVIVQDPAEALVPSMPEHALAAVGTGVEVLPVARIGPALATLSEVTAGMRDDTSVGAAKDLIEESRRRPVGPATGFTCPECSGALWELSDGGLVRYRCRIGHAYSEESMLVEQGTTVEAALWTALEVLEERAELLRRMSERRAGTTPQSRGRLSAAADDALERANLIRRALVTGSGAADAFAFDSSATGGDEA